MTEDQIKHLANRFLGWAIPDDFNPDNGVHFDGWIGNKGVEGYEYRRHLTGTNLLNANQAEAMVRHMLNGLPQPTPSDDLVERMAELQLAAFLAGRGSVTNMMHGTRTCKPAPSMDDFRRMAIAALAGEQ